MARRGITDGCCFLSAGREATEDVGFVVGAFLAVVVGFVVDVAFVEGEEVGWGVAQRGEGAMIAQSIHANHATRRAEGTRLLWIAFKPGSVLRFCCRLDLCG